MAEPAHSTPVCNNHRPSRRGLLSRALLAAVGGAIAPQAVEKATAPVMTFEEARKAYPVTVKEAGSIMYEFYKADGPVVGPFPKREA